MMVSLKALAAIAVTLIVCVPISLGYALAIDEETTTALESTDSWSLDDAILNHESPYYNSRYTGTTNNSTVLVDGAVMPVDYVSTSSTVTSYPSMQVGTTSAQLGAFTTAEASLYGSSTSITPDETTIYAALVRTPIAFTPTSGTTSHAAGASTTLTASDDFMPDVADLTINSTSWTVAVTNSAGTTTSQQTASATMRLVRASSSSWDVTLGSSEYAEVSQIAITWTAAGSSTLTYGVVQSMPSPSVVWDSTVGAGVLRLTTSSGELWVATDAGTVLACDGSGGLSVGSNTYAGCTAIAWATSASTTIYWTDEQSVGYTLSSAGISPTINAGSHARYRFVTPPSSSWTITWFSGSSSDSVSGTGARSALVWQSSDSTWGIVLGSSDVTSSATGWIMTFRHSGGQYNVGDTIYAADLQLQPRAFSATVTSALIAYGRTERSLTYQRITTETAISWDGSSTLTEGGATVSTAASDVYLVSLDASDIDLDRAAYTVGNASGDRVLGTHDTYLINIADTDWRLTITTATGTSIFAETGNTLKVLRDSASTWTVTDERTTTSAVTSWTVASTDDGTLRAWMSDAAAIDVSAWTAWSFAAEGTVRLTVSGSDVWVPCESSVTVAGSGSAVVVGDASYSPVSAVALAQTTGTSVTVGWETASTKGYGDPSFGWRLPSSTATWTNLQQNSRADLYLQLSAGSSATITVGGTDVMISVGSDGTATADSRTLGAYTSFEVVCTSSAIEIYGITAWPSMGASAQRMNSVTVDRGVPADFSGIVLSGSSAIWRVDNATIKAGDFPTTMDYMLDLSVLFPSVTQSVVQIDSVAVYGDSLTIAGKEYAVKDGAITITDADTGRDMAQRVRAMSITTLDGGTGGTYRILINGHSVGSSDAVAGGLTFGGEWSLGVTLYRMEEVQHTSMEWQPGGFGLDEEGVLAAAMLTALGAFVVLGMTGRASGPKAAFLALICGGATLIAMIILG